MLLLVYSWLKHMALHDVFIDLGPVYRCKFAKPFISSGHTFSGWLLYWIDLLVRYELLTLEFNVFQPHKFPWEQSSWGQHGAHLGPTGPRRAPCWPHELCYRGYVTIFLKGKIYLTAKYEMFQRYPTGHLSYNYKKAINYASFQTIVIFTNIRFQPKASILINQLMVINTCIGNSIVGIDGITFLLKDHTKLGWTWRNTVKHLVQATPNPKT